MKLHCKVKVEKDFSGRNTHFLVMPNGEKIPGQVWSRVYTGINEAPYAIVKLFVEIDK